MTFFSYYLYFTTKGKKIIGRENLDDLGYCDAFLDTTPKTQSMTERLDKLDFIKM